MTNELQKIPIVKELQVKEVVANLKWRGDVIAKELQIEFIEV
jgi:hypothetical protein